MTPLCEGKRTVKVATLSAAVTFSAMSLGLLSCGSDKDGDGMRDSVMVQPPLSDTEINDDSFAADNDIAMTVRSVADAINVGEAIDSLGYSFRGVLTDGTGMPLFTDIDGLPGEWEVEVVSPSVVRIRNVNNGDLVSEDLVSYIAAALQLDDDDTLQLISERESANRKVEVFSFGKGTLTIETEPNRGPDREMGDKILITMRADRQPQEPVISSDSMKNRTEMRTL